MPRKGPSPFSDVCLPSSAEVMALAEISAGLLSLRGALATMTSNMSAPSRRPFPKNHPLEGDEARLDHIASLMRASIQKVLFPQHHAPPYPPNGPERALAGGTSAEHVLQDALAALLYYDENMVQSTWEAVGIRIARNKAVEALRKATKGRRRATGPELQLVSLDANREAGEELRDDVFDAEAEYIAINQQLILCRLAQQVLSLRDRDIYYRVHYLRTPLVELAPRYDLSPPRVGQIYAKSARKLHAAAQSDPGFLQVRDPAKGGTDDE